VLLVQPLVEVVEVVEAIQLPPPLLVEAGVMAVMGTLSFIRGDNHGN
jgi:hypothetical protein